MGPLSSLDARRLLPRKSTPSTLRRCVRQEKTTMKKYYVHYVRYALALLANVGFGINLN